MPTLKAAFELFRDAGIAWSRDRASLFAAAIAYYMAFSLAPLLVFSISVAGIFFGAAAVEGEIVAQVADFIGPQAAAQLESLLEGVSVGASSFTVISTVILVYAASGVFIHLKRSLNVIYGVIPKVAPGLKGAIYVLRTRFFTFLLVLGVGLLLLVALAIGTVSAALGDFLNQFVPEVATAVSYVNQILAPVLTFVLFSILFKTLPDAEVAWRDVWLGAAVTTVLFTLGNYLISLYLRFASVGSVYGAASSFIVLLFWIYYSAQIVMYGAEFTKVYASRYGKAIVPDSRAMYIAEHYNEFMPPETEEPAAEPPPEPRTAAIPEPPAEPEAPAVEPPTQRRKQLAAGLLGLALGLFLAFLGQLRDDS